MNNRSEETLRWPRPGYPLVPALYRRAWSDEPLPRAILRRAGLPSHTVVGALDERVWEESENPEGLRALGSYVNTLIKARLYFRGEPDLADRPILGSTWSAAVDPTGLPFSARTRNVLGRAERLGDAPWMSTVTATELFSLRGAGTVTLLDFATVAEAHEATVRSWREELRAAREELGSLRSAYPIDSISPSDPRLRELRLSGRSLAEGLEHVIADGERDLPSKQPAEALARIEEARRLLRKLDAEKLDESLLGLVRGTVPARHVEAITSRLGWDGMGGCTLKEASEVAEVSRERVRQVQATLEASLKTVTYVPALDRAVAVLDRAADAFEPDAASLLQREGITSESFLPAGVAEAARVLRRPYRFEVGRDKSRVQTPGDAKGKVFRQALRSLSNVNYVASVLELQARILEAEGREPTLENVGAFLELHPNVVWLNDDKSWFWVRQAEGRNRVVGQIRKMLAAAGSLPLETLREGVLRHHRTRSTIVPRSVLVGLCRAAGFQVRDGVVSASERIEIGRVLGGIETTMVEILRSHGGIIQGADFEDECLKRGINRHSFWVYLTYSVVLERVAPSVYALRGAEIDPAEVAYLASREIAAEPTVQDGGWTRDGAIWLGYGVRRNTLSSGVVSVPAGIRSMVGQRRLELFAIDGTSVGTFVVSGTGQAWGITPFLGRRGVEVGDALIIALDTELGIAVVQAGGKDLLLTYQDGEGWGPQHFLNEATRPSDGELLDEG